VKSNSKILYKAFTGYQQDILLHDFLKLRTKESSKNSRVQTVTIPCRGLQPVILWGWPRFTKAFDHKIYLNNIPTVTMKIFLQDIFGTVEIGIENMVQQFYSMNAEAGFKGISSAGGICVK
jgi:hypothetical protein